MKKVFLSHKSEDKPYVEYVANSIGKDNCVYDKYTFEDGMQTLNEILKGMDETDLFVLFISRKALESKWVKREIREAHLRLDIQQIRKIYPIIIDSSVLYDDKMIPVWMQREYNIRPILSPKIAVSKIKARMRELTWADNEGVFIEQNFFFGRNSEIAEFEKRKADLDKEDLKCVIASSGFKGIGRKSYIEQSLKKVHVMNPYYKYHLINLEKNESIEDFILKISDLGITEIAIKDLVSASLDQKIEIAIDIVKNVQKHREYIFINDKGVIVKPNQEIVNWFERIIKKIDASIVFGIASDYSVRGYRANESIFGIRIPELSIVDRRGMLIECCNIKGLSVSRDVLKTIAENLTGYPEQIYFVVNMLSEEGVHYALNHLDEAREYSLDKAYKVIECFEGDNKAIEFLVFLSNFDFVNMEMLDIIFKEECSLKDYYYKFLALSICEFLGSDKEYVKINDVMKDYLFRQKLSMGNKLKNLMDMIVNYSVDDQFIETTDLATYYAVIKKNIENIDEKYIIPSHYLKCIVEAYNRQEYKKSLRLCKTLIDNQSLSSFDNEIIKEIYYYLCLSLAREHDEEFFSYIKLDYYEQADRKFLYGFYYRIKGNFIKAIENLREAIDLRNNFPRAKRELVNAYIMAEDFENAYDYSKDNYSNDKVNPFHIQSYFKTIINMPMDVEKIEIMKELIKNIEKINSPIAKQMYTEMQAIFLAKIEDDEEQAIAIINNDMRENGSSIYLLLVKFDIYEQNKHIEGMEKTLDEIERLIVNNSYYSNAFYIRKAKLLAAKGEKSEEVVKCIKRLKYLPEKTVIKLSEKLGIKR